MPDHPLREPDPTAPPSIALAREEEDDRRIRRRAVVVAVGVHLLVLGLRIPQLVAEPVFEEPPKDVFVMQTHKWEPPDPQPEPEVPEVRPVRQPVPDPTPDDPEPIRPLTDEIVPADVVEVDRLIGIPSAPPPVAPPGPVHVVGEVTKPIRVSTPEPVYTEPARRARKEGVVIVEAIIDRDGRVTNARILKGLGFGLDEATLAAVKTWRFEPATLRGEPVAVYYNLTVHFQLH